MNTEQYPTFKANFFSFHAVILVFFSPGLIDQDQHLPHSCGKGNKIPAASGGLLMQQFTHKKLETPTNLSLEWR